MPKKYLIIIFVILAALVAIDISIRVFLRVPATSSDMVIVNDNTNVPANIAASFFCPDGKIINAVFENAPKNQVSLDLSDGRKIILPHARSADGARYANADESFVFWNKGNGAFIQENGKETFSACTAS
jgi:membrane-bound inhibitor of C-type lysozyme